MFADVAHETVLLAQGLATQPLLGTDTWHTLQCGSHGHSSRVKAIKAHEPTLGSMALKSKDQTGLEPVPPGDPGGVRMCPGSDNTAVSIHLQAPCGNQRVIPSSTPDRAGPPGGGVELAAAGALRGAASEWTSHPHTFQADTDGVLRLRSYAGHCL